MLLLCSAALTTSVSGQQRQWSRDELIAEAREIMTTTRYCALISIDRYGHAQARTMDAFAPARSLYASFGFKPCGPFGNYVEDPYSVFMTREV